MLPKVINVLHLSRNHIACALVSDVVLMPMLALNWITVAGKTAIDAAAADLLLTNIFSETARPADADVVAFLLFCKSAHPATHVACQYYC